MPLFLLGLFKNLNAKSIGILIAVALIAFGVFKLNGLMNERDDLILQNSNMREEMLLADLEREVLENGNVELSLRLEEIDKTTKEIETIEEKINESTEDEDGSVSIILRNTLIDIDRLRNN